MTHKATLNSISETDYLEGELTSDIRHEYMNGQIFAMSGASEKHNIISLNTATEIKNKLKQANSDCRTYSSDMKVKATKAVFYYPDVIVSCNDESNSEYYRTNPILIVEVLSESTRKKDRTEKRIYYQNIPSLQEYILIEQDKCEIEVSRRSEQWRSLFYYEGDSIDIESLRITLLVEDIYYQTDILNL